MFGIGLIIFACVFWALDALIRYPLIAGGIDALTIVFIEHCILGIVAAIYTLKHVKKVLKTEMIDVFYFFMVGGLGSAIATLAFTKAFSILNPSLVILLQKFQPIIAITLASVVLKEKIHKDFLMWAFVCLIGALIISYQDIVRIFNTDLSFDGSLGLGYFLVAVSVIGWAFATVFGKKLSMIGYNEKEILSGRILTGLITLFAIGSFSQVDFDLSVQAYQKISLMVLLSGLVALYLYYLGMKRVKARNAALAEMFFPFAAVIINWVFLDMPLEPWQILGGVVLLIGSSVIQIKDY
jgi:drug/metabolite transporter (DMT)-like permease